MTFKTDSFLPVAVIEEYNMEPESTTTTTISSRKSRLGLGEASTPAAAQPTQTQQSTAPVTDLLVDLSTVAFILRPRK